GDQDHRRHRRRGDRRRTVRPGVLGSRCGASNVRGLGAGRSRAVAGGPARAGPHHLLVRQATLRPRRRL
ncbi:MAG: hypothetical protein AVDCRST_MAG61-2897, partial [uncultured Friedmanniella sp.]